MKDESQRLPEVSPKVLETLAVQASDTARQALAAFVKRMIEEQYRPDPKLADSTTAPSAPRSEQTFANTQNKKQKKGNKI